MGRCRAGTTNSAAKDDQAGRVEFVVTNADRTTRFFIYAACTAVILFVGYYFYQQSKTPDLEEYMKFCAALKDKGNAISRRRPRRSLPGRLADLLEQPRPRLRAFDFRRRLAQIYGLKKPAVMSGGLLVDR